MVVHVTSKDLQSSHRGVQPVHFAPSDAQDFCQVNKLLLPLFLHAELFFFAVALSLALPIEGRWYCDSQAI